MLAKITTLDGLVGWGKSVPIARWSYETLETVETVLREYFGPALLGHDASDIPGAHLELETNPPPVQPARAPPQLELAF